MDRAAPGIERTGRRVASLCEVVEGVESALDALRELLMLANGRKVDPGGVAALLAPLVAQLGQATHDLNELRL